jgi:hypothetical protein
VNVEIRPPTEKDLDELVRAMRAEDRAECIACGYEPGEGLRRAVEDSGEHVLALVIDYQVAAIWGVVPVKDGIGAVWALTSTVVNRHRKIFWRFSVRAFERLTTEWPFLFAAVDARYTAAVRWLKRLGFTIGEASLGFGTSVPFHHATYRRAA